MSGKGVRLILKALEAKLYSVDDEGRIHSHKYGDRVLACGVHPKTGYLIVNITVDGERATVYAHRFVAFAKLGMPAGDRNQVNHIDGNRTNNHPGNLEWVTAQQNSLHAVHAGLRKTKCLDASLIGEVKKLLAQGVSRRVTAIRLGVNKNTVNKIALSISHQ